MSENYVFPILWDIVLVETSGYFAVPGSAGVFLSCKLYAMSENHNSSVIEFLIKNRYGYWVESKTKIGLPEVFEISGYAARLTARKNDFAVRGVGDTSDYSADILITLRNGLGQQNQPLSFYISMCSSGFTGSDAPLTKEFLGCLYKLTNQEIPHYLNF